MTSVMWWTSRVPSVPSLSVTVELEPSWDQTDKHVWVSQRQRLGLIYDMEEKEAETLHVLWPHYLQSLFRNKEQQLKQEGVS